MTTTTTETHPTVGTDAERRGISRQPFRALGGQPGFEPDDLENFVAADRIAVLAYVRKDGRPGQIPVWYTYADGAFHLSTSTGTPKHLALLRDPRVCLTIQDERPPYRAVMFDGVAEVHTHREDGPTQGIERRYFGRIGGAMYERMEAEHWAEQGRVEITVRPQDVRGFDNTHAIGAATLAFARLRPHLPLLRRWL